MNSIAQQRHAETWRFFFLHQMGIIVHFIVQNTIQTIKEQW